MTATLSIPLADEAATIRLGQRLAGLVRTGDVLALSGGLGAGKTTLARALIRALTDPDEEVPSPTFTLVQGYDAEAGPVWHFDLYRLDRPDDAVELGLDDALADGITLIEWPERLGPLLPRRRLDLRLAVAPTGRVADLIDAGGAWADRLACLTETS
ncbi:MAG: tRNA (adenosine(37)-N6)-threonylcarbamoyltransferase complex ATPase subunit type 1 TsaE [Actinomycetota bacterium]